MQDFFRFLDNEAELLQELDICFLLFPDFSKLFDADKFVGRGFIVFPQRADSLLVILVHLPYEIEHVGLEFDIILGLYQGLLFEKCQVLPDGYFGYSEMFREFGYGEFFYEVESTDLSEPRLAFPA